MPRWERIPLEVRFWAKVDKNGATPVHRPELGPCWMWTAALNDAGYGAINPGGRAGSYLRAHRVSAQLAGMNIEGKVVRHECDNPACVNPRHLIVGTQADNIADMHDRGRSGVTGEKHHYAKLTEDQVREILASELSNKRLALLYRVSESNISAIRRRISWKHIDIAA